MAKAGAVVVRWLTVSTLCAAQARNVAITVRTIIVGLMYLATFIFSANALGLTGGQLIGVNLGHYIFHTGGSRHVVHVAPCGCRCGGDPLTTVKVYTKDDELKCFVPDRMVVVV